MRALVVFFLLFAVAFAQRGGRGGHGDRDESGGRDGRGGRGRGDRDRDSHDHDDHRHHGGPRFPFPFPRQHDVCHSCIRQPLVITNGFSSSPCVFQPGTQLSCTSCCQSVANQQPWGTQYRGAFLMQFGNQWGCSCCFDTFNCRQ